MNRRGFLKLLAGAGAATATSYFFAPVGGWHSDVIVNPHTPLTPSALEMAIARQHAYYAQQPRPNYWYVHPEMYKRCQELMRKPGTILVAQQGMRLGDIIIADSSQPDDGVARKNLGIAGVWTTREYMKLGLPGMAYYESTERDRV